MEPKLPEVVMPGEDVRTSKIKKASGGYLSNAYENFKAMYTDEYTGEILRGHLARAATIDELDYFNEHVWQVETLEKAKQVPDYILVRSRWVMANNEDFKEPDVRARFVGCEVNKIEEKVDAFCASAPPLDAKKLFFSQFASERKRRNHPLGLSFVDVHKAYFNRRPTRNIYMQFPKELGLAPNLVGNTCALRLWLQRRGTHLGGMLSRSLTFSRLSGW